jgi:phage terminase small subunit
MPAPKKPASVHRIKGTYRNDRHSGGVEVESVMPEMPEWISGEAKQLWEKIAPDLKDAGYLTKLDGVALATYCELVCQFIADRENFAPQKLTQMRSFMGELGLTPGARAKLPAINKEKPNNSFEGM